MIVFINQIFTILEFAIIARILISWVAPHVRGSRLIEILEFVTEPILRIARMIPHQIGMLDLSPLIALFGLNFLQIIIRHLLSPFL